MGDLEVAAASDLGSTSPQHGRVCSLSGNQSVRPPASADVDAVVEAVVTCFSIDALASALTTEFVRGRGREI